MDNGKDNSMHRLTVAEAAAHLGITSDAVRQRIRRGSIAHERDQDGKVYVYIRGDETRQDTYKDELLKELRNRIEFQERELERKDTIIMSLTQRIPELQPAPETSSEERESPETASEDAGNGAATPEEDRRPWWRRWFEG